MGLLDALTGNAAKTATRNGQQALLAGQTLGGNAAKTATRNGQQALLAGQTLGVGQINDRLGDATRLLFGDGGSGANALRSGYDYARQGLRDQYADTQSLYSQLGNLYAPMAQGGASAFNALVDATGANGAAGNARATENFQAGPGYQFAMDQGLGAINRTAASRGMLASGNTSADLLKYATGLADQTYGNYVSRLQGVAPYYQAGLAGQASGITGQAGASQTFGQNLASLDNGFGQNLSGLYGQLAGLNVNAGQNSANLINSASSKIADLGMAGAQGQTQASANAISGILGAGKLLSGLF